MLVVSTTTTDRDGPAKALLAAVKSIDGTTIDSGLFEGEIHPESELTIAEIGAVNEFGTRDGRVPERSWLRRSVRENQSAWDAALDRVRDKVLAGENLFPLLMAFGERVASDIRGTIDKVLSPPKAESTLRSEGGPLRRTKTGRVKKGAREFQARFDHPLIWLGYMRAAVRSRIAMLHQSTKMTPKAKR